MSGPCGRIYCLCPLEPLPASDQLRQQFVTSVTERQITHTTGQEHSMIPGTHFIVDRIAPSGEAQIQERTIQQEEIPVEGIQRCPVAASDQDMLDIWI